MSKETGPKSTSFQLSAAGIISGLGILITGYVQNTNGEATTAHSIVGGALALGSIVAKLWHDGVFRKASIAAALTSVTADLPAWKADVSKAVSFVEEDLPGVKTVISDVQGKIASLEGRIPDLGNIESVVRQVLTELLKPPAA